MIEGVSLRVLIVDDYRDNVESLAMLLRIAGHETETALSGKEALRLASVHRPDIVFCDLSMPDMNGYEVARQMRERFQGNVMLVAVTALGSEDARGKSREAGFDRHLIKPTDPEQIVELLREGDRSRL